MLSLEVSMLESVASGETHHDFLLLFVMTTATAITAAMMRTMRTEGCQSLSLMLKCSFDGASGEFEHQDNDRHDDENDKDLGS